MLRLGLIGLAMLGLGACAEGPATPTAAPDRPMRIVSLDYCADQYVLRLVEPERILALSPDAAADFSYMREAAGGIPTVRPLAEDVLLLEPDLVVRSFGGGPNAAELFARAGVPVAQVGYAGTVDDIESVLGQMATALGADAEGDALTAEMRARLERLAHSVTGQTALYMTPWGVTTGPGSLVHDMLRIAGLTNFVDEPGWRTIPLERLAYETPDRIAAAYFDTGTARLNAWSAMRHPIAHAQLSDRPTTYLNGAWTSCGSWFLLDAVEALANAPVTGSTQ